MEDSSGAPRCARCSKPVFFAEEVVANRKRWHKLCLKCAECSKQLDSSTLADHEGEVYCHNCYGKLFGPKGFGSHGLSSDTGRRRSTSGSNIKPSHEFSKAQVQASASPGRGGADACPRCKKPVYFAEEKVVEYKKWHVNCVTCAKCNKRLDSSTLTEHEGEVYCHNCHKKLFGPKGFGFGGLSMDDGTNMIYPNRSNVPSTDLAYLAPRVNGQEYIEDGEEIVHVPRRASYGSSDICPRCGGPVYAAEKMTGAGSSWHKTCFSCAECNKKLDSSNLTDKEGEIFCKACYGKYFGAKGYGFGGGAGTLQTGEYSL